MNVNNLAVVLNSQQRRLRIINQILLRNITIPTKSNNFEIFFTINHPSTKDEIFKSMPLTSTTNPSWSTLHFQNVVSSEFLSLKSFLFKLCLKCLPANPTGEVIIFERHIYLNSLLYVGNELTINSSSLSNCPNNIFIKMSGTGFYVLSDIIDNFKNNLSNKFLGTDKVTSVYVPIELIKNAYSVEQLNSMNTLFGQINQSTKRISMMDSKIVNILSFKQNANNNVLRYEYVQANLQSSHKSNLNLYYANRQHTSFLNDLFLQIMSEEIELKLLNEKIESTMLQYKTIENSITCDKINIRDFKNKLNDQQKTLLNDLQFIFPMNSKVSRIARFNEFCALSFPKIEFSLSKNNVNRFNRTDIAIKKLTRQATTPTASMKSTNSSSQASAAPNSTNSLAIINNVVSIFNVTIEETNQSETINAVLQLLAQMVVIICDIIGLKPLFLITSGYNQRLLSNELSDNFANYQPNIDNFFHPKSPYFKNNLILLYRAIEEIRFKCGIINNVSLVNNLVELYTAINSIFTSFGRATSSLPRHRRAAPLSKQHVLLETSDPMNEDQSMITNSSANNMASKNCDYDEPIAIINQMKKSSSVNTLNK